MRLVSCQKQYQIYANQLKAKGITKFPVEGMEKFYVNENLTQRKKRLFWLAKQKVKELKYEYLWTHNGQIYDWKNENSEKFQVNTENDFN